MRCVSKNDLQLILYKACENYSDGFGLFSEAWEKIEEMLEPENNNNGFKVAGIYIVSYKPNIELFVID